MKRQGQGWKRGGRGLGALCLVGSFVAGASCQDLPGPLAVPSFRQPDGRTVVQEGEMTLADGGETTIHYKKHFAAPPRLTIAEFRRSWFKEKPYAKSDFVFVAQDATGFRVQNTHPEVGLGAVATVKWRAEGVLAAVQPVPKIPATLAGRGPLTPEQIAAAVTALGGKVTFNAALPAHPIVAVDLHHTRVTDADLEGLRTLTQLRILNLSGTAVSDTGLAAVEGMKTLQTLLLNQTRVTDAGLPYLQRLGELRELSLYQARVTDEGLASLKGLTNLHDLTLSGSHITDQGLAQFTGLKNLRHLYLSQTAVSKSGVQQLKKALPKVEIIQ